MEWQDLIEILEKYITADCNKTWRLMDWTLSRSKFEKMPLPAYLDMALSFISCLFITLIFLEVYNSPSNLLLHFLSQSYGTRKMK